MELKEELLIHLASDNLENLRWELKNSRKCLDENGKFNGFDFAKIIVSLANREGGYIVIGINDDGFFEGNNLFEIFESNGKEGFDVLKQNFFNVVRDKISPSIQIDINKIKVDEYDIAIIEVPMRKGIPHAVIKGRDGGRIKERQYYVRTSHGNELVDDDHLTWLFNNTKLPKFVAKLNTEVISDKDCLPLIANTVNYEEVLEPVGSNQILRSYLLLNMQEIKTLEMEVKIQILIECFFHSLLWSLGDYLEHKSERLHNIEYIGDSFISENYINNDLWSKRHFYGVINACLKEDVIIQYDSKRGWFCLSSETPFYKITLEVLYNKQFIGLSSYNPYQWLGIKSFEDSTLRSERGVYDYITHLFEINFSGTMKYPEKFNDDYYRELHYLEKYVEVLNQYWNVSDFHKSYPHHIKLYEINKRIQNIEQYLKTKS